MVVTVLAPNIHKRYSLTIAQNIHKFSKNTVLLMKVKNMIDKKLNPYLCKI